jgi:hypothetical protein
MVTAMAVIALAGALVGLAGSLFGLYQKVRAGKFGEVAAGAVETLEQTEKTRDAMVVVINALPSDAPLTKKLKTGIEFVAGEWKVNETDLAPAVKALQEVARLAGFGDKKSDQANLEQLAVVAKAVEAARAERYPALLEVPRPGGVAGVLGGLMGGMGLKGPMGLMGLVLVGLLWAGCAATPERYTRETVWPGDPVRGYPAEIVVRWPAGTHRGDVYTTEISSETLSVAPMK